MAISVHNGGAEMINTVYHPEKVANVQIGSIVFTQEDFRQMKDMLEFMRWVEGNDSELAKQLLAFKTFKKVTK
jgi:hypothetical protein